MRPVPLAAMLILPGLILPGGAVAAAALPPSFCAAAEAGIAPLAARPWRSLRDFGARGDGIHDDTAALQAALDHVPAGAILDFPPGRYLYSRVLTLTTPDVILRGRRALLEARQPAAEALVLAGDRTAVLGLRLRGAPSRRLDTPQSALLVVRGRAVQVIGARLTGAASVGIFVDGATDFRLAGNRVAATRADGIHMTHGARSGLVARNRVEGTGDDLISVVSYRPPAGSAEGQAMGGQPGLSGRIVIRDNEVSANVWGRGISVVGGEHVAIRHNGIHGIPTAAGIYIAQESSFHTYGASHITVTGNLLSDIETAPRSGKVAGHGAIDINTSLEAPVQFITVENNRIDRAGFAGIRVSGPVCSVRLAGNTLSRLWSRMPAAGAIPIESIAGGDCAAAEAAGGPGAEETAEPPVWQACVAP